MLEILFDRSHDYLAAEGYLAEQGQIVDASIVPVPIQRISHEENRRIKSGEVPEDWSEGEGSQTDVDVRWTKKNDKSYFGYENHIDVDSVHKLMSTLAVTPANVYESQVLDDLILPISRGHPVKRVRYATEVNHDQNEQDKRGEPQAVFAGVQNRGAVADQPCRGEGRGQAARGRPTKHVAANSAQSVSFFTICLWTAKKAGLFEVPSKMSWKLFSVSRRIG